MISLAGEWQFQMGFEDAKPAEVPFGDRIQIPGILQAQGYGENISTTTPWVSSLHDPLWYLREEYRRGQEDGVNVPFLSQPPKHFLGVAWYQREIEIEEGCYEFVISCTRWKTEVYVDDKFMGSEVSLCAPHHFYLGRLDCGRHTLVVKIDNRMQYPYRPDGHGVSDALAATWNGMTGQVFLRKIPDLSLGKLVLKQELEERTVKAEIGFCNRTGEKAEAELCISVTDIESGAQRETVQRVHLPEGESARSFVLDCAGLSGLWDEYHPDVQLFQVQLLSAWGEEKKELPFGFRHIQVKDGRFYINDRPVYLRGTHFGGEFPLLGYPSDKQEDWERIFGICKLWGLNFVRFHSFCPPEAAFVAADHVGIYLQVECAMWNVFQEGNGMDKVLCEETERILENFGHHPSFIALSPSNEPSGDWAVVLAKWYRWCKASEEAYSGQRLYTRQSGWPYPVEPSEIDNTDYVYFHRSGYGPYNGGTIRNSVGWANKDYRASLKGIQYPVITHEMGQWCSYPDFDIIDKFTGYMHPGNYKIFRENARAAGVLSQNKEFVRASGKLQVQMYKEDLEANFRTPCIYGYELLDLHDYLGQGGAFVGVLDAFWDNKGYVQPEEFRQFCNETVLLLRIEKRVYTQAETLYAEAEMSHFGREALRGAEVSWQLLNQRQEIVKEGSFGEKDYELAKNQKIGVLVLPLEEFAAPECYTIRMVLDNKSGDKNQKMVENSWKIWLYEQQTELPKLKSAVYTRELSEALQALKEGRRVVYSPYLSMLDFSCPYLNGKPSFWNSQMGPRWSRGMGLLCKESHPALRNFPTNDYQEYQWNEILRDAKGINLKNLPEELIPIVQPIDEWNRSYRLGLVLEAKVGEGSLLLLTADLEKDQEFYPAKRQLLKSLLLYADSSEFCPKCTISREELLSSFADTQVLKRLNAVGKLLEYPDADVSAALDGNPNTTFCIREKHPYTLEIAWEKEEELTGLVYMPVQNQREHEGDIREYEVYGLVGSEWKCVAEGEFLSSFEPKTVVFDRELQTNSLRLVAKSGFGGDKVQTYVMNQEGWFRQEGHFEDHACSISAIMPLTKQGVFAAEADIKESRTSAKTATIEIEE